MKTESFRNVDIVSELMSNVFKIFKYKNTYLAVLDVFIIFFFYFFFLIENA